MKGKDQYYCCFFIVLFILFILVIFVPDTNKVMVEHFLSRKRISRGSGSGLVDHPHDSHHHYPPHGSPSSAQDSQFCGCDPVTQIYSNPVRTEIKEKIVYKCVPEEEEEEQPPEEECGCVKTEIKYVPKTETKIKYMNSCAPKIIHHQTRVQQCS